MTKRWSIYKRKVTRRRTVVGLLSILMVLMLVAVACGEDATATPVPSTATPEPGATATPVVVTATPVPPTALRPRSEWTVDNPATLAEIEVALEEHRGESFTFVAAGGAYSAALHRAYLVPFSRQFGIEVIEDSPGSISKVRAMVEAQNVTWHVVDTFTQGINSLTKSGSLEELDKSVVDTRDFMDVLASLPTAGGGGLTWGNTVNFSLETWPDGGPQPDTMAKIFDAENFPGRRSFSGLGSGWNISIRFALIAEHPELLATKEGRDSLASLSQAQLDEGMQLMEEFAPSVDYWWTSGSDCPSLILSGEIDICTAWAGRIFDAQQQGAPIKTCWTCGFVLNTQAEVIPKGLKAQDPRKFELAQLYLAWAAFPENNVRISAEISYGPANIKAIPALTGSDYNHIRSELPSSAANLPYGVVANELSDGVQHDTNVQRYLTFLETVGQ